MQDVVTAYKAVIGIEQEILKAFQAALRPEPRLTVTEWAEAKRMLDGKSSAEPGPYRVDRTPFNREIMDNLSVVSPVQQVIVMKGVQLGLTEIGNNWIGYIIDNAPGPIMAVQPTVDMMQRTSKMRIAPMIETCETLRNKVKSPRSRDSGNTINQKEFPNGVLILTGANSATGLRSMPARYLFLDEIDAYPLDVDGEGGPISLAEKRTSTFGSRKKIYKISTPTVDGMSAIEAEFRKTDQRYYHVPCPHCGTLQILWFKQLRWQEGKYDDVHYECGHCAEKIYERHKSWMFSLGKWIPTKPENTREETVGYHISSLYSPDGWTSWKDIAVMWDEVKDVEANKKTFINTILGETYKEDVDVPAWESIYDRRESYPLNVPPIDVCFLTAGVDVQKDRLELEIVGWARGKQSYSIDYRVLLGDTAEQHVWMELDKVLNETWVREDGTQMNIRVMAIDTGYNTGYVYDYCGRQDITRVIPIKGQDAQTVMVSPPRAVHITSNGKKIDHVKVWHVGVSLIIGELYGWLKLRKKEEADGFPPGYCHFPQYDEYHFKSLTAEVLEKQETKRGFAKYVWVNKFKRNERLDCRVYARAAAAVLNMDLFTDQIWTDLQANAGMPAPKKKPDSGKRKSSFWNK